MAQWHTSGFQADLKVGRIGGLTGVSGVSKVGLALPGVFFFGF